MYKQTFTGGDNILHLLVRSEGLLNDYHWKRQQGEQTAVEMQDEKVSIYVKRDLENALTFIYFMLGPPHRFLKLLSKPNYMEGISPALLATNLRGQAYKVLRNFFQKHSTAFTPHYGEGAIVGAFMGLGASQLFIPDTSLAGLGVITAGAALCYGTFYKKNKDFEKVNKDLHLPISVF